MEARRFYFPVKMITSEPTAEAVETSITPAYYHSVNPNNFNLYQNYIKCYCSVHSSRTPPDDFLKLALSAQSCGWSNVLYKLAKAVGTMRCDQSDSLLPAK